MLTGPGTAVMMEGWWTVMMATNVTLVVNLLISEKKKEKKKKVGYAIAGGSFSNAFGWSYRRTV